MNKWKINRSVYAGDSRYYIDRIVLVDGVNGKKVENQISVCSVASLAEARLIAAAPDLLAALKELVARCDGEEGVGADGSNIQTIAAHAAIKKAEGE